MTNYHKKEGESKTDCLRMGTKKHSHIDSCESTWLCLV